MSMQNGSSPTHSRLLGASTGALRPLRQQLHLHFVKPSLRQTRCILTNCAHSPSPWEQDYHRVNARPPARLVGRIKLREERSPTLLGGGGWQVLKLVLEQPGKRHV